VCVRIGEVHVHEQWRNAHCSRVRVVDLRPRSMSGLVC
jgi:hypothetical protein